jgi:hypothetical protein
VLGADALHHAGWLRLLLTLAQAVQLVQVGLILKQGRMLFALQLTSVPPTAVFALSVHQQSPGPVQKSAQHAMQYNTDCLYI